jgi:hypothetical protein
LAADDSGAPGARDSELPGRAAIDTALEAGRVTAKDAAGTMTDAVLATEGSTSVALRAALTKLVVTVSGRIWSFEPDASGLVDWLVVEVFSTAEPVGREEGPVGLGVGSDACGGVAAERPVRVSTACWADWGCSTG